MARPRVDASVSPPNHRAPCPCLLPPYHRHLSPSTSFTNPPKPNSSTIAPTSGRRLYPLTSGCSSSVGARRILKQRLKEGSPESPCLEIAAGLDSRVNCRFGRVEWKV
ncbi:hypothetical protein GUJ93_ZPchr0012g21334 [Zizania palustris]|uniref:Uncharacterized protein n=1 Tax=Zizania palustris TaxID=103762 RepID=A0A8J5WUP2_ZIZPA|nr:hypothetical protein GUJ93_ZPchr0012g21334 [Zizania palustris]